MKNLDNEEKKNKQTPQKNQKQTKSVIFTCLHVYNKLNDIT